MDVYENICKYPGKYTVNNALLLNLICKLLINYAVSLKYLFMLYITCF
jgi:hypothetical protein